MLKFILLQNRQGKTRLSRWWESIHPTERIRVEQEIQRLQSRDRRHGTIIEHAKYKLVIRQYANLTFVLGIDQYENQLAARELIHLIVETLDRLFGNVCELDLVYHFDKVYQVVDECVIDGEICETDKDAIIAQVNKYASGHSAPV